MESPTLDAAGHRRSPATMLGDHCGRPPRNKGEQYPVGPPPTEEIVAVMGIVGDRLEGHRLRALITLLWHAGLRIIEALSLQEGDLDRSRAAVLVRCGKAASVARLNAGAANARKRVIALSDETTVTVIELETGEVLSSHLIQPNKACWRNQNKEPGRWPSSTKRGPMSRLT